MESLEEIVIPIEPIYSDYVINCGKCSHFFTESVKIYPHDSLNPQKLSCPHCSELMEIKFLKNGE